MTIRMLGRGHRASFCRSATSQTATKSAARNPETPRPIDGGNRLQLVALMRCTCRLWVAGMALATSTHALPAQILETETARILKRGAIEVASNFEFQTAKDGREYAVPLAIEFGLLDRMELLIEPVAYTSIRPSMGRQATGRGDIEVTMTTLLARESASHPAFAVAERLRFLRRRTR